MRDQLSLRGFVIMLLAAGLLGLIGSFHAHSSHNSALAASNDSSWASTFASTASQIAGVAPAKFRATSVAVQYENPSESIRVMTFNIRYHNSGDGQNAWPHRKERVVELIKSQELDFFGLQEALPDQAEFLVDQLPEYEYFGAGRDDGDQAGEQVPVFVRKDKFEVVGQGHFWLSTTPNTPGSRDWDAAITRMVTWVRIRDRVGATEILFANTHFDHRGAEARRESASLIRTKLHEIGDGLPIVLTGDFNCLPSDDPYITITNTNSESRALRDTREKSVVEPVGPASTWNGFSAVEPGRRIDFVFVSEEVNVLDHHTLDIQYDGRFPSDHLPVVTTIEVDRNR